jgi:hypothetical protein
MKKYSNIFSCEVCGRGYSKPMSHLSCFKKFCTICKKSFTNETIKYKHCVEEHSDKFCKICNCIADDLKNHLKKQHNIDYEG